MLEKRLSAIAKKDMFDIQWDYQETSSRTHYEQEEAFSQVYRKDKMSALLQYGFKKEIWEGTPSFSYVMYLCKSFTTYILQTPDLITQKDQICFDMAKEKFETYANACGYMLGQELIDEVYIEHFMNALFTQYQKEIKQWKYDVEGYLWKYAGRQSAGRVFFHMVEYEGEEPFAFLATYAKYNEEHKIKHVPLQLALKEFEHDQEALMRLLKTVHQVAQKSTFLHALIESGELFQTLKLNVEEAYTLLKEIPLYEEHGIICRVPKWFKSNQHHLKVNIQLAQHKNATIGISSLLEFDVHVALGGECLSVEELRKLEKESQGLSYIKGKWVEINHEELAQVLLTYHEIEKDLHRGISIRDAMRYQLGIQEAGNVDTSLIEVHHGVWLEQLTQARDCRRNREIHTKGITATLRPYQSQGVQWLIALHDMGFGACLADDMGLGKTLQILVAMHAFAQDEEKTLLIIPASLIGNWLHECKQFAPTLRVFVYHSSISSKPLEELSVDAYDVVLTTYQMITKSPVLCQLHWDNLILDEAQLIKNPMSKQTRQIKSIQATHRFALSGTPIENHVRDLWSLFDFLNPGLLGSIQEFKKLMKTNQPQQFARLKQFTSPFILRRLKSDKSIISDLPKKIERKEYVSLSKKQIALYRLLLKDLKQRLQESDGIERKGIVLSTIIKCKQLCNHPDQYIGNSMFLPEESGKFLYLKQLCEHIYEQRERVLVFTQFKEMVEPLANFLETIFHQKGVFLHGGTNVKKRQAYVAQFQGDAYVPFMVLSIKAGGVGLNLTQATHVIHFDRWWNPAVENQASDRAYRIGQKHNVFIHKFISEGTIEQQIDELIDRKLQLVEDVLSNHQEISITQMSNQEILSLFDYGGDTL